MALAYLTINLDAFTGDDHPPVSQYSTITLDPGVDHIDAANDVIHVRSIVVSLDQQGKAATANGVPCVDGRVPVVAGVAYAVSAPNVLRSGPHYIPALTAGQVVDLSDSITPGAPLTPDQAATLTARIVALEETPPGVTDHGALTGLGDDDHPQYALADGSRGLFASTAQGATADAALAASAALAEAVWLGLPELIRDTMATALVAGANVTITPNDGADTLTIAASGGGGGGGGVVPPEPFIIPPGVGQYLPVLAYGGHYIFPCTGGRSYPCPQYAHEAMNVDAVGVKVDTGVGGATIELALYTWGGGITSTLVSTLGSVDASSAGLKVLTFTPLSLAAGLHLIVARPSATVSVWGVSGGTMVQEGPPDAGSNRFQFPHHAAASLPSSITWDYGAGVYGNNFPKFQMRRSA